MMFGLTGCKNAKLPAEVVEQLSEGKGAFNFKHCDEEIDTVVLDKLGETGLNTLIYKIDSAESATKVQTELNCIRTWVKTVKDDCTRWPYNKWLDFYQTQINNKINEIEESASGKKTSSYEREEEIKAQKVARYKETHNIPSPEKCTR
jgi:hypothetical protein